MNTRTKALSLLVIATIGTAALTGCTQASAAFEERSELQDAYDTSDSLELRNLTEKREREDDPNQIRYLYLLSFGQIIGYYVTQGKISSNGSQITPEQELVKGWEAAGEGEELYIVDSAQDDGSYGSGDPGIFFFTTDGVMVVTSLDYIQSDAPLGVDVPRLGGTE